MNVCNVYELAVQTSIWEGQVMAADATSLNMLEGLLFKQQTFVYVI